MKYIIKKSAALFLAASVALSGIPASASSAANTTALASESSTAATSANTTIFISASTVTARRLSAESSAAQTASILTGQTHIVTSSDGLDVYSGPSVSYDRLLTLGCGDQLTVTNTTYSSGWTKISCGGHSDGWVSTEDLAASSTVITAPKEYSYSGKQAKILASALTVYATASSSYINTLTGKSNLAGSLYNGQVVDAIGYTTNGFTKVQYDVNGTIITGYVNSTWVKISAKPSNTPKETFTKIYGYSAQIKTEYEAVSIYASPRMDASILATLKSGQVVTILSQSANWYRITLNVNDEMLTGYIYRSFATRKNALSNLYLSKTSKTLKVRQKYQLALRGTTGMNVKVSWKSSKKKVASVNSRGYIVAKKAGTTKITCTVKVGNRTKKLTCKIRVKK